MNQENAAATAEYKKVHDHMIAFRRERYPWWRVAEFTYDAFMIRAPARG